MPSAFSPRKIKALIESRTEASVTAIEVDGRTNYAVTVVMGDKWAVVRAPLSANDRGRSRANLLANVRRALRAEGARA